MTKSQNHRGELRAFNRTQSRVQFHPRRPRSVNPSRSVRLSAIAGKLAGKTFQVQSSPGLSEESFRHHAARQPTRWQNQHRTHHKGHGTQRKKNSTHLYTKTEQQGHRKRDSIQHRDGRRIQNCAIRGGARQIKVPFCVSPILTLRFVQFSCAAQTRIALIVKKRCATCSTTHFCLRHVCRRFLMSRCLFVVSPTTAHKRQCHQCQWSLPFPTARPFRQPRVESISTYPSWRGKNPTHIHCCTTSWCLKVISCVFVCVCSSANGRSRTLFPK